MALTAVRRASDLELLCVLAPERYDPRRELSASPNARCTPLRTLVLVDRKVIHPQAGADARCVVLDTSDAREGVIVGRRSPQRVCELGSAKKRLAPKDVIISRLRPYLRQVALVDERVPNWNDETLLLCSTEFFVLRSVDANSVAFLVPFLLSESVQEVLAASQEGGHHPRFNEEALLNLPVPVGMVTERNAISEEVERSVAIYRDFEARTASLVAQAEAFVRS